MLSAKSIQQIHTGANSKVLNTLSSSLFRRGMRLYLPIVFSTLCAFVVVRFDYFVQDPHYPVPSNIYPPRLTTLSQQVWHYLESLIRLTKVYNPPLIDAPYAYPYDGHLWTIPVEYHGSIIVFLIILLTSQLKSALRPVLIMANAVYTLWQGDWDIFLFLSGVLIADIHGILQEDGIIDQYRSISNVLSNNTIKQSLIWSTFVFGSLALGCVEDEPQSVYPSPFYAYLHFWCPGNYSSRGKAATFWAAIGAVLVVLSMSFSPTLQRPFTTRFAQYLGFVSYALYLLHGNVLYTIGTSMLRDKIVESMGSMEWPGKEWGVGYEGVAEGYHFAFIKTALICIPIIFWAGDLFTRYVDLPCVRFAIWVEGRCIRKRAPSLPSQ